MEAEGARGVPGVQKCLAVLLTLGLTSFLSSTQADVSDQYVEEFDFVIVGAGSAGSVLADRLTECRLRVLLLDAGGDQPVQSIKPGLFTELPHTPYDFNYTSKNDHVTFQTHKIRALNLTSGRMLGGGSSINYMLYVRGCSEDYEHWADAAQDPTWNWHGVYPYFLKSENLQSKNITRSPYTIYHGKKGFLKVTREDSSSIYKYIRSFEEVGKPFNFDVNGPDSLGYTPPLYTIANGKRQSTAYTNLRRIKNRPNFVLRKYSFVTKVIIDDDNVATGVEYLTQDNRTVRVRARREVVLSAGTFNSARLLMLSGVGPRDQLQPLGIPIKSELPVGYNYQDHTMVLLSMQTEKSNAPLPPMNLDRIPFPIFVGYISLDEDECCPEYQAVNFDIPNDSPGPSQLCSSNFDFEDYICKTLYDAGKGRKTIFTNLNLMHPRSRGRVKLRSLDPRDDPVVEPETFSDERDLDDLASYVQDYLKVLNSTYFRSIGAEFVDLSSPNCKEHEFGSQEYWRCYVLSTSSTMYHYSGTCAMGAVVDARLRVLGVRGLRVVDASVIPRLPSANINAPVIMIAEKAADFIKSHYHCL